MDHPTVEETAALAGALHASQTDKAGKPYIGHLGRVARHLVRLFPDANLAERHAAWLHDVIEDTATTAHDLAARGYDPDIIAIVSALTRPKDGRSYQQWIEELAESAPVSALRVKRADLTDNSDLARLDLLPPDKAASLARRYARAIEMIDAAIAARSPIDADDGISWGQHVPITLTVEPAHRLALNDGAEIAGRGMEQFIGEESFYLADMLVSAGRDSVRLARDHTVGRATPIKVYAGSRAPRTAADTSETAGNAGSGSEPED